jgi:phage regulator Rha-like protein
MNELTKTAQGATMSSVEIAKLTGKQHGKVTEDIQKILKECEIDDAVFRTIYLDKYNRNQNCYNLPKRECTLIVAGYSAKYRLAIIDRWQELENAQTKLPSTLPEALRLYADEVEAHEKTKEITAKLLTNAKCYDVSVVAKECGFRSAQAFNDVLQDEGWVFKQNGFWKEYADKVWMKYFRHGSVVTPAGVRTILQITEKGRLFFVERYKS